MLRCDVVRSVTSCSRWKLDLLLLQTSLPTGDVTLSIFLKLARFDTRVNYCHFWRRVTRVVVILEKLCQFDFTCCWKRCSSRYHKQNKALCTTCWRLLKLSLKVFLSLVFDIFYRQCWVNVGLMPFSPLYFFHKSSVYNHASITVRLSSGTLPNQFARIDWMWQTYSI